ncbi:MAG TPA: hypothetical protein VEL79_09305 [Vicinamibacterales bacterium]|nr:hypothetical protein [Vicinamibacterales bacterium]
MARRFRISITASIVCLVWTEWSGALLAAGPSGPASPPDGQRLTLGEPALSAFTLTGTNASQRAWDRGTLFAPADATAFAQRGWGRRRGGRNSGARTAVIVGSVAAIAGTAVLVYANRPECGANHSASGCGYGTKVVGGAVMAAGAVGVVVGALSWR